MKTITRRTALAASVSLPLLPVSAFAAPADPVIPAYRTWRAAYDANDAFLATGRDDEHPEGKVLYNRVWAARLALSDAVATTPAGLACQVRFAFAVFGDPGHNGDIENPEDFTFDNWSEDHEGRLLAPCWPVPRTWRGWRHEHHSNPH